MKGPRSHPNPLLVNTSLRGDIESASRYYKVMRTLFRYCTMGPLRVRVFNRHLEPATGGVVYISNHQSFLDPVLVAFTLQRPMNFMARDSLFKNRVFKWMIESVHTFPVRRGKADTGAIKEAMRRLKNGRQLTIFPEGTRCVDGHIEPFMPGVAIMSQRAAEWTVPVLIDGAYEAWPRSRPLPGAGDIIVQYGKPIHQSEARKLKPAEFAEHVRQKIIDIQTEVRQRIGRPTLEY
ncbi:MAG: 1-acyl-sn-glycerol-3-phosphate acyltransferase [Phycisphaerae bacterium]|nr:1-acyl-sn-glycerol-3-phosphate acyltransferase [Phycisphaerae bacterium]